MQPDFQLPECYTVDNVHRVREKIPGFSDETLFWIFYTQPRDIMQELAASELYVFSFLQENHTENKTGPTATGATIRNS